MPKPILFDEPKRKKKKKRKKRKVDYAALLAAPASVQRQCTHTKRVMDASLCSQCMLVQPSIVHKPVTRDWWADDPELELSLENIANSLGSSTVIELDDENGYIDLKPDDD